MHPFRVLLTTLPWSTLSPCLAAPIVGNHQAPLNPDVPAAEDVRKALLDSAIIPDILTDFLPTIFPRATYRSTSQPPSIDLGTHIPPSNASSPPLLSLAPLTAFSPTRTLNPNTSYTLALSDPDATSRVDPIKSQMCHWIITGLKLSSSSTLHEFHTFPRAEAMQEVDDVYPFTVDRMRESMLETEGTHEIFPYMAPAPPPKTGDHRYVFVVLAPKGSKDKTLQAPRERPHFGYGKVGAGVKEWADDNGLVAVGANFFYAKNDKQ